MAALLTALALVTLSAAGLVAWEIRQTLDERDRAIRAEEQAERKSKEEETSRKKAENETARADARAEDSRRSLANSRLPLAEKAWNDNDTVRALALLDEVPHDLRFFEWNHRRREYQGGIFTLLGHTRCIRRIVVSPDGTRIATASEDWTARVWDARTGELLHTFTGVKSRDYYPLAIDLDFSPDGARLAVLFLTGTIRTWDVVSGKMLFSTDVVDKGAGYVTVLGRKDWETCAARPFLRFSPDGMLLATASAHKNGSFTAGLLDAHSGQQLPTLFEEGNTSDGNFTAEDTAFSPDGRFLAARNINDTRTGRKLFKGAPVVRFSPDARLFATADGRLLVRNDDEPGEALVGKSSNVVRLHDGQTGKEVAVLSGHSAPVFDVNFSPDGNYLCTASLDRSVRLWQTDTAKELFVFRSPNGMFRLPRFSPDARSVATVGGDRVVRIWDVVTGKETNALRGHTDRVWDLCFTPDGQKLVTCSADLTAHVWDVRPGRPALTVQGGSRLYQAVAFSPDGRRFACACAENTARIWDSFTGQELVVCRGHGKRVFGVTFSPDGGQLATASEDATVRLWDARTGKETAVLRGPASIASSVAYSPDGKQLAAGWFDGAVQIWDPFARRELRKLEGLSRVSGLSFGPEGRQLAAGGSRSLESGGSLNVETNVVIWDTSTGNKLETFDRAGELHKSEVNGSSFECCCLSPDGLLLAAPVGAEIHLHSLGGRQKAVILKGHTRRVTALRFSPAGERLASASDDSTVRLWDVRTGQEVEVLKHAEDVCALSFSPDGSRLITAEYQGKVQVWDSRPPRRLLRLPAPNKRAESIALSPDGSRLAYDWSRQTVRIWDADTGKHVTDIREPSLDGVTSIRFSPDGTRLAIGGQHGKTAGIWDLADARRLVAIPIDDPWGVYNLTFSPDGRRLAGECRDEKTRVWDADTGMQQAGPPDFPLVREHAVKAGKWPGGDGGVELGRLSWGTASADGNRLVVAPNGFDTFDIVVLDLRSLDESERSFRRAATAADQSWHASQVQESWKAGAWFTAAFHLGRQMPVYPWDAGLHVRRAYALSRLGRTAEAAADYLCASLLDPRASMWPLDPAAGRRGESAAQASDWPRAVANFELAAHQPRAALSDWSNLLLARQATGSMETRQVCRELLDRFETNAGVSRNLVYSCLVSPCHEADALRLVMVAERLVAARREASSLDKLGAALYRAGRFEEAARTLQEAIASHGKGGFADTWLFLAMTQQRLGRTEEARGYLSRFEGWLKSKQFATWQETTRWRLLHVEARNSVVAMPRATE